MSAPSPSGVFCKGCGYDLAGVPGSLCPECSRAFDRADPRTFDPEAGSRRRRRIRRIVVLFIALVAVAYAVGPRGYVCGVMVRASGKSATLERTTQWRLAPPRWLARVPYPYWTIGELEPGVTPPETGPSGEPMLVITLDRCRWFRPGQLVARIGIVESGMDSERADRFLDVQVRRQCMGMKGIWLSLDEADAPEEMRAVDNPW